MSKFINWYVFISFRAHYKKWFFPIIVLICGLIVINVSLGALIIVNSIIDKNFTNNNDLKLMNVNYDAQSATFTNQFINSMPPNDKYLVAPFVNHKIEPMEIMVNGEYENLRFIALPYEMLNYLGLDNYFDEEEWNNSDVIIPDDSLKEYGVGSVNIPVQDIVKINLNKKEQVIPGDSLLNDVKIVNDINDYFVPKKWQGYSFIPLEMWYKIEANSLGMSTEEFKETINFSQGLIIIVNNFEDIEDVANQFASNRYIVDYGLSDFENLTNTLSQVQFGALILTLLILIIMFLTNYNSINQFLNQQKHEIGLQKSLGINNKTIIGYTMGEIFLQSLIVLIIVVPIQFLLIKYILGNWFNDYAEYFWFIELCLLGINLLFMILITTLGGGIPVLKIIKTKTIDLLNKGE